MLDGQQCGGSKDEGPPQCGCSTPFPINTGTGNKYLQATDYAGRGADRLAFIYYYNSKSTGLTTTLGAGRRHNYSASITADLKIDNIPVVSIMRPTGVSYTFVVNGNTYAPQDADVTDKLVRNTDGNGNTTGWGYTVATDDSVESYDAAGKLISIRDRAGMVQTLVYSTALTSPDVAPAPGLLIQVTDSFGRQLNFTYDSASRINKMMDPANGTYLYAYDGGNNLASVTYPDGKIKSYLYNEPAYTGGAALPNALTGIVDEKGVRYASYYYNADGKAVAEQHAGGVDQYHLSFSPDGSSTTVTDPLGTARTTNFAKILGITKAIGHSQPGGAGCSAAANAAQYDANGNVWKRTDFNGNVTTYAYDLTRNLETSRVEAFGTADARTITTQWHPQYHLPALIAEPKRITTFEYDPSGNLMTRTVQATNDANGSQGAGAVPVGTPRIWRYTYNQYGQVKTAVDPNTNTTSYEYDSATGNLLSMTNAASHVTTFSNYDANGRVGRIVDANGLVTDLHYSPRGWLLSKIVTGTGINEATGYDYDDVGQLQKATMPDGSYVTYTYDDAHRLTDIRDSDDNMIHFALDAIGNRTNEQVKDPLGNLSRQITRIYDALNRLQTITGGTQ